MLRCLHNVSRRFFVFFCAPVMPSHVTSSSTTIGGSGGDGASAAETDILCFCSVTLLSPRVSCNLPLAFLFFSLLNTKRDACTDTRRRIQIQTQTDSRQTHPSMCVRLFTPLSLAQFLYPYMTLLHPSGYVHTTTFEKKSQCQRRITSPDTGLIRLTCF